ncbi:hypothetical protein [Clostridium magnum]|uniref:Uncharacterized protein n=1 Tax=Clostridium magnum DSM 2767 TaxID=1121326 RepID=A0A162QRK6_9CLOT|nr:hypothetical protein [Clostridium magnum]KZL88869.1 hypothetical protein CLMAG_57730 [Clostridium magnum DSM 2767]SHI50820.1 hypothetical protein SAMN02745944_04415 [Clostridium magnum DSM 2767]
MSLKRNKDDNINNNFISIVSRVVKIYDDKWEKKFQRTMQQYAKLVTACAHTFEEIEQYFLEQCDALPLPSNDSRIKLFQGYVVMDSSKNRPENGVPRFSNMKDEEIDKWHKKRSAMFLEAECAPPQQFGLNIHGYYLPHTERNKIFYEQAYQGDNICFLFEETTGYYQFSCAGCSLMYQVIIFIGISEEDIEKHTQRFIGYINAMIKMGYLTNLFEER